MSAMQQAVLPAACREPTHEECAWMARDGYLVVRDFFDAEQARDLLRWTRELETAAEMPGRHCVYHADSLAEPGRRLIQRIENFCPFHPGFDRLIRHGALLRWTGKLIRASYCPILSTSWKDSTHALKPLSNVAM